MNKEKTMLDNLISIALINYTRIGQHPRPNSRMLGMQESLVALLKPALPYIEENKDLFFEPDADIIETIKSIKTDFDIYFEEEEEPAQQEQTIN